MSRTRKNVPAAAKLDGDISFPVSYREQARYLKLADDFLALDFLALEKRPQRAAVISIEAGRGAKNKTILDRENKQRA